MSLERVSQNAVPTADNTETRQSLRILAVVLAIMFSLGMALTFKASANPGDKKTIVTFSSPVELPGKALPAGTYVFKLLDDTGSRDIVQVFDKDEKQLLATLIGIPDYRDRPADKTTINFEERRSDTPPAVKAIYFAGDTYGVEFVYPHDRAVQLAKRTGQNVLSMPNDMQQNMAAQASSKSSPSVQQLEKTEVTGVDPSGGPVEVVIIVGPKPEK